MDSYRCSYAVITDENHCHFGLKSQTGVQTKLLFDCEQTATELAAMLEAQELSPIHLQEVVQDYFYELSYNTIS